MNNFLMVKYIENSIKISIKNSIENFIKKFIKDEDGGTEVVAILLIIIILIGLVIIFKDKLAELLGQLFDRILSDVNTKL